MAKIPMRFRILHLMSVYEMLSDEEIMKALKEEYGTEGQLKKSIIDSHLQSMRAVGMIENADVSLDENDNIKIKYKITDYGLSRLKYLPKGWKPGVPGSQNVNA